MRQPLRVLLAFAVAFSATIGILLLVSWPAGSAWANAGMRYVSPDGDDAGDCADPGNPCRTVQRAVDVAADEDQILLATGSYTGVQNVPSLNTATFTATQLVVITKSVTIRGGYTTTGWTRDLTAYPTTLNAEGAGRVVCTAGSISITLDGLRISGGDATGLGGRLGGVTTFNVGGGLYSEGASLTLRDSFVVSNAAEHEGGGMYVNDGSVILSGTTISGNVSGDLGFGGGAYLRSGDASLTHNTFTFNSAGQGGGGLYLSSIDATVGGNTFIHNECLWGNGGGLYLHNCQGTVERNSVLSNTTRYYGGGMRLSSSDASLDGNVIRFNACTHANGSGGGMYVNRGGPTLVNNVVADNRSRRAGSGILVACASPHLLHNTFARNYDGDGTGLHVTGCSLGGPVYSEVALTNTVVVSHTVGITITGGSAVTVHGVLWYSNTLAHVGGAGTVTVSDAITGAPAFVSDGYHLTGGSPAIGNGVDGGVLRDIDTEPRVGVPDLGADEYVLHIYLPYSLRSL